jgi:hypothetical protein
MQRRDKPEYRERAPNFFVLGEDRASKCAKAVAKFEQTTVQEVI